jgi:hypothetical protein
MRAALPVACLLPCAGCLVPALVGGQYLPADELTRGALQLSIESERSRRLDATGLTDAQGSPADLWWLSSDVSARVGATDELGLEGGVKLAWALPFPLPAPIGLYGGAIWRFETGDPALALAVRGQLAGGSISVRQGAGTDAPYTSDYTFGGGTLSGLATARPLPWLALTASPFVRGMGFRHVETGTRVRDVGGPTFSAGLSLSAQLSAWVFELAPGVTVEVASNPFGGPPLLAPTAGFALGMRP